MTIQWFSGRMAKAKREIEEKLNLVDLVIELVDARVPLSSQNPMIQEVIQNKPKLILMMKKDLADNDATDKWLKYFKNKGIHALAVNANDHNDIQRAIHLVHRLGQESLQKHIARGIQ